MKKSGKSYQEPAGTADGLRKTGIGIVGDIPWGTHFCHFYETHEDLLDVLIPYFKTGLENNEFCMWIVFPPRKKEEAIGALKLALPGTDRHLEARDIEIISHTQWYLKNGTFDLRRVIDGWQKKLADALSRGYAGMRVNGNEAWLTEKDWKDFLEYEERLNDVISDRRIIVLCTYPLAQAKATDIFDVAHSHEFAIARRRGNWEVLETPELSHAKTEIMKLNEELGRGVDERTRELARTNEDLRKEIAERKRAGEALKESEEKLRLYSKELEETNSALKVLLRQRENDRGEIEEKILANVKQLVLPYVEMLKKSRCVNSEDAASLNIIESNLNEIISSFAASLSHKLGKLTPKEILIANLVKEGHPDKEIANTLHLSIDTIKAHRRNIRKKLGISGKKTNLRSFLSAIK